MRLYHDDVHILAKEVREATKRTLAKKDRLEQQKPEEGKPSIKVTVARWAVEEANTPCKLEWLRELRNLTRGPDEKEERLEGSFDWVDGRRV